MSHLYVLKDEISGFLKIGRANDVITRVRNLRVANPNLNILQIIETEYSPEIETFIHNRFAHCRQRGEFFQVTADEVSREIRQALKVIQDRPDRAILEATEAALAADSLRDANQNEIDLLNSLLELRAEKASLKLLETALIERLKVSIGNNAGLRDWATYKSHLREGIDTLSLQRDHPEILEKYKTQTGYRVLKVRKFDPVNYSV
jgi:hypothetical protein